MFTLDESIPDPKYISNEEYPILLDINFCSWMLFSGPVNPLIDGGAMVPLQTVPTFSLNLEYAAKLSSFERMSVSVVLADIQWFI